jgi:hypothetical protein
MKYNNAITAFAAFACAMLVGCSAEEEVTKSTFPAFSGRKKRSLAINA